jgi:hypothetical protein
MPNESPDISLSMPLRTVTAAIAVELCSQFQARHHRKEIGPGSSCTEFQPSALGRIRTL